MEYLAPISILVLIAISGLLLYKANRKKPVVTSKDANTEDANTEDSKTEDVLPDPTDSESSKHVIPAGKYPTNRGDGTIRPGDEMWEIFQMTLKGNRVLGNRLDNGDVEVKVLPLKNANSDNESKESPEKF